MNVNKKNIAHLTKCYSIAGLTYQNKPHFLVAAEKQDPCLLFDMEGNQVDTIWQGPGGVMSMVQVPNSDGQFLATQKFYSPNDSKEAKIVIVTPTGEGTWDVQTLVELPHVHRFDIIRNNNINYLIACTLKSGHEYRDDWSMPGKVYAAILSDNLADYNQDNQLELTVIKEEMLKNHGYYKVLEDNKETSVISCENGVYQFIPPPTIEDEWQVKTLLNTPASDAVLVDLDEDGEKELAVIAPFHGEKIRIYKKINSQFIKVYEYEKETKFLHAIYGGELCGKPTLVVGHRECERNLLAFTYNNQTASYEVCIIDEGCGPANVYCYQKNEMNILIAANREIDEVAMYTLSNS